MRQQKPIDKDKLISDYKENKRLDIVGYDDDTIISVIQALETDRYGFVLRHKQIPALVAGLQTKKDKLIPCLDLGENKLNDLAITNLIQAISVAHLKINSLYLQKNIITDTGLDAIAEFIKKDKNIKSLYLADNFFTENAVQQFFLALRKNTTLNQLDLILENYNLDTQMVLLDTLRENNTLCYLRSDREWLDDTHVAIRKKAEINQYLAAYGSLFAETSKILSHVNVSSVIRKEIPTNSSTGTVSIKNFFKGKPLLVNFEYEEETQKKIFLLLDWQLLIPYDLLPVPLHFFYEWLLKQNFVIQIYTGNSCYEIKPEDNINNFYSLHSQLKRLKFTPALREKVLDKLCSTVNINNYILWDYRSVRMAINLIRNKIDRSFKFRKALDDYLSLIMQETYVDYLSKPENKDSINLIDNIDWSEIFRVPGEMRSYIHYQQIRELIPKLTKLKKFEFTIEDKKDIDALAGLPPSLEYLHLSFKGPESLLTDLKNILEIILPDKPNKFSLFLVLLNVKNLELILSPKIAQNLIRLDVTISGNQYPEMDIFCYQPITIATLSLSGMTIDFSKISNIKIKNLFLENSIYQNMTPDILMDSLGNGAKLSALYGEYIVPHYQDGDEYVRRVPGELKSFSTFDKEIRKLNSLFFVDKETSDQVTPMSPNDFRFDLNTGLDKSLHEYRQWYINEGENDFTTEDNCLRVYNKAFLKNGELQFGTEVTTKELVFKQPVKTNFNQLHEDALAYVSLIHKDSMPDSRFYLAEITLDFSGDSSGNLGPGWMILPTRSLFDILMVVGCSDPRIHFSLLQIFPTQQIAIKNSEGESKKPVKFRYIGATQSLLNLPYSKAQFGKQTDPDIDKFLKTLQSISLKPTSEFLAKYPNIVNLFQELNKNIKNPTAQSLLKCIDLIAGYCSGFTLNTLKPADFSDLFGYSLSRGLNHFANVSLNQYGKCCHRSEVCALFLNFLNHFNIHWTIIKSDSHEYVIAWAPDEQGWNPILLKNLGGAPTNKFIMPLSFEKLPSNLIPEKKLEFKVLGAPLESKLSILPRQEDNISSEPTSSSEIKQNSRSRRQIESKSELKIEVQSTIEPKTDIELPPRSAQLDIRVNPPDPIAIDEHGAAAEQDSKNRVAPPEQTATGGMPNFFAFKTQNEPDLSDEQIFEKAFEKLVKKLLAKFVPYRHWAYDCETLEDFIAKLFEQSRPLITCQQDDFVFGFLCAITQYLKAKNWLPYFSFVTSETELLALLSEDVLTDNGQYLQDQPGILRQKTAAKQPIILLIDWSKIKNSPRFQSLLDTQPKLDNFEIPEDEFKSGMRKYRIISLNKEIPQDNQADFFGRCQLIPFPQKLILQINRFSSMLNFDNLCKLMPAEEKIPESAVIAHLQHNSYWQGELIGSIFVDNKGKLSVRHGALTQILECKDSILILDNIAKESFDELKDFLVKALILNYRFNARFYAFKKSELLPNLQLWRRSYVIPRPKWLPLLKNEFEIADWAQNNLWKTVISNPETDFMPAIVVDNKGKVISSQGPTILDCDEKTHILIETTALPPEEQQQHIFYQLEHLYLQGRFKGKIAQYIKPPLEDKKVDYKDTSKHQVIKSNQPLASLLELQQNGQAGEGSEVIFLHEEIKADKIIEEYQVTSPKSEEMPCFPRKLQLGGTILCEGGHLILVGVSERALTLNLFYQLETIIYGNYLWLNGEYIKLTGKLTLIIHADQNNINLTQCKLTHHQYQFSDYYHLLKHHQKIGYWPRLQLFYELVQPNPNSISIFWCQRLLENIGPNNWAQIETLLNSFHQKSGSEIIAYQRVIAKILFCAPDDISEDTIEDKETVDFKPELSSTVKWQSLDQYPPQILLKIFAIKSWKQVNHILNKEVSILPKLTSRAEQLSQKWLQENHRPKEQKVAEFKTDSLVVEIIKLLNQPVLNFLGPPGAGKSYILKLVKKYLEKRGYCVKLYLGELALPIFLKDAKNIKSGDKTIRIIQFDEGNMNPLQMNYCYYQLYQKNKKLWQPEGYYCLGKNDLVVFTGNFINFPGRYPLPDFFDTLCFPTPSDQFLRTNIIAPRIKLSAIFIDSVAKILLAGYYWLQVNLPYLDFSPRNLHDALSLLDILIPKNFFGPSLIEVKQLTVAAAYRRFSGCVQETEQKNNLEKTLRRAGDFSEEHKLPLRPMSFPEFEQKLRKKGLDLPPSIMHFVRMVFEALTIRGQSKPGACHIPVLIAEAEPGCGKSTVLKACLQVYGFVDANSSAAKGVSPTRWYYMLNMSNYADNIIDIASTQGSVILLDEFNTMHRAQEKRFNLIVDLIMTKDDQLQYTQIQNLKQGQYIHPLTFFFCTMNSSKYSGRQRLSNAVLNRSHYLYMELTSQDFKEIARQKQHPMPELLATAFICLRDLATNKKELPCGYREFRNVLDLNLKLLRVNGSIPLKKKNLETNLLKICDAIIQVCAGLLPENEQFALFKYIITHPSIKQIVRQLTVPFKQAFQQTLAPDKMVTISVGPKTST